MGANPPLRNRLSRFRMPRITRRLPWIAAASALTILVAGGAAVVEQAQTTHQAPARAPEIDKPHVGPTRAPQTGTCTGTTPPGPTEWSRTIDEPGPIEKRAPRTCGLKPPGATATGTETTPRQ